MVFILRENVVRLRFADLVREFRGAPAVTLVKRPKSIAFTLECAGRQKRGQLFFFCPPDRLKYARRTPGLHAFADVATASIRARTSMLRRCGMKYRVASHRDALLTQVPVFGALQCDARELPAIPLE
jgi:hypothetical protein